MIINLIKFRDDLIEPKRAHYNDAGIDCFAQEDFTLKLDEICMIPLGFGLEVPDGYMATIRPRSSWNTKGIITQIGTIDSGYRGEIKAVFFKPNKGLKNCEIEEIKKGDKICQIVIEPVILADFVADFHEGGRGNGGFGSTGK